jgi:hypothetical protein
MYNLTFLLSAVFPIYRYKKRRKLAESSNVVLPTTVSDACTINVLLALAEALACAINCARK